MLLRDAFSLTEERKKINVASFYGEEETLYDIETMYSWSGYYGGEKDFPEVVKKAGDGIKAFRNPLYVVEVANPQPLILFDREGNRYACFRFNDPESAKKAYKKDVKEKRVKARLLI